MMKYGKSGAERFMERCGYRWSEIDGRYIDILKQTSTGPIANVIGIDFGNGDVSAMYPFNRKDSSMAQEKAFWVVIPEKHNHLGLAELTRHATFFEARARAQYYAETYPGAPVTVLKAVGHAKIQQPAWTDYE